MQADDQPARPSQRAVDETAAVRDFYDSIVAYEWSRLDHYVLEFATVKRYLTQYLPPPPAKLLDIGGGPGRYAILLAELGYEVTLIDLAPENITWAIDQAALAQTPLRAMLGDARDLSRFADGAFDAVLLLGPLYHLPAETERQQAVREARRVLRTGGKLFSMMLTLAAAIYEGFNRWPEGVLEQAQVQQLLLTGNGFNFEKNPHDFEGVHYSHPNLVAPLHEGQRFRTLALAGCEGILGGRRAAMEQLDAALQARWIELMWEICEDPAVLGASERLLYVGEAIVAREDPR